MTNHNFGKADILIIGRSDEASPIAKAFQSKKIKSEFFNLNKDEKELDSKCADEHLKLVIEDNVEQLYEKEKLLKRIDQLCPPGVIIATNSALINPYKLVEEVKGKDRIVWINFLFPELQMNTCEYSNIHETKEENLKTVSDYLTLGRIESVRLLKCRKGGAAGIIFISLLLEATRMIDDGADLSTIEKASRQVFKLSNGFLSLIDEIGIPKIVSFLSSFSDSTDGEDDLYKSYDNFFTPSKTIEELFERYEKEDGKSYIKLMPESDARKEVKDLMLLDMLERRFLGVLFMTSTEVVNAGLIEMEDMDRLCTKTFKWKEGPFAMMNRLSLKEAMRIVTEKMELSHRKEINFPIPDLLINQMQKNSPWNLKE